MDQGYDWKQVVDQIIALTDDNGQKYMDKYSTEGIVSILDKKKLQEISEAVTNKKITILQFVRLFLNYIPHEQIQTIYLTIGLIEIYRSVIQDTNNSNKTVIFSQLTDYLCKKILQDSQKYKTIQPRLISLPQTNNNKKNLDHNTNPPYIFGTDGQKLCKIAPDSILIDKSHHNNIVTRCAYSKQKKLIMAFQLLAENIGIYNEKCQLIHKVKPTISQYKKGIAILNFAFSEKQQRIGAVLKDYSMSFWDLNDNFQYQKSISTSNNSLPLQTDIWFLQQLDAWITADKLGVIHIWNLLLDKPERALKCKFRAEIKDLAQIGSLGLLAIIQENQQRKQQRLNSQPTIYLYNFMKGTIQLSINLNGGRIPHTIQFIINYQAILTSAYEKSIKVFSFDSKNLEATLRGQLTGHQSIVTTFTPIKDTPMVISCDDKANVKLWDIRSLKCIQTYQFCDKMIITKCLDLVNVGKIAVLGSRVNILSFEQEKEFHQEVTKQKEKIAPLKIAYDQSLQILLILTEVDLRIIDLRTGKLKEIFCYFMNNDFDITYFKYLPSIKKYAVGADNGRILLYDLTTGKQTDQLQPHQNAISFIEYDTVNNMFVSGSYDSNINIQKKKGDKFQIVRTYRNNFFGKQITVMQMSIYHSLIAISSQDSSLILWDYLNAKIIAEIVSAPFQASRYQFTAVNFINGLNCIVAALSDGTVVILKMIKINNKLHLQEVYKQKLQEAATQISVNYGYRGIANKWLQNLKVYFCLKNGTIQMRDLTERVQKYTIEPHAKTAMNYNPQRQIKENFANQKTKNKFSVFYIFQKTATPSEKLDQHQHQLTAMKPFFLKKSYKKFGTTVLNDDDQPQVKKITLKAHKDTITSCQFAEIMHTYIITSSLDRRVKIWVQSKFNTIQLKCDMNLNWPLPYKWDILIMDQDKKREKVMIGLKVLKRIFENWTGKISFEELRCLKVDKLIGLVKKKVQTNNQNMDKKNTNELTRSRRLFTKQIMLTQPSFSHKNKQEKIQLMQQVYSKKDLLYNDIRKHNFTQIAGPSLRELDYIKKNMNMQKEWKKGQIQRSEEKQQLMKQILKKAQKIQEKQQITQFLSKNKQKLLGNQKNQEGLPKKIMNTIKAYQAKQKNSQRAQLKLSHSKNFVSTFSLMMTIFNSENDSKNVKKSSKMGLKDQKGKQNQFYKYYQQSLEKYNTTQNIKERILKTSENERKGHSKQKSVRNIIKDMQHRRKSYQKKKGNMNKVMSESDYKFLESHRNTLS